jgi:hypothetical protein
MNNDTFVGHNNDHTGDLGVYKVLIFSTVTGTESILCEKSIPSRIESPRGGGGIEKETSILSSSRNSGGIEGRV